MSDKSKIEWTDATWNPVTGCSKVSQGCKHCYAERDWTRLSANPKSVYYGREFTDVQCHHERLDQPLRWRKPRRIFVNSMSDLFHESVPVEYIDQVFAVMLLAPQHVFQVLTKRPERMREYVRPSNGRDMIRAVYNQCWFMRDKGDLGAALRSLRGQTSWPSPNVWLGVSVEDQATADERIPLLLDTPAAVRFLSCEPLLGPIDLERACEITNDGFHRPGWPIDGVITGGESGPNARPSHPHWFESMRDQCAVAGVPFHFKQWGEWLPWLQFNEAGIDDDDPEQSRYQALVWNVQTRAWESINGAWWDGDQWVIADDGDHPAQAMGRVGKKRAGRLLDGREHNELPAQGDPRA